MCSADFTLCPKRAESRDDLRLPRTTILERKLTKLQKFSLFSFAHAPTEDSKVWRQELLVARMNTTFKLVALE